METETIHYPGLLAAITRVMEATERTALANERQADASERIADALEKMHAYDDLGQAGLRVIR